MSTFKRRFIHQFRERSLAAAKDPARERDYMEGCAQIRVLIRGWVIDHPDHVLHYKTLPKNGTAMGILEPRVVELMGANDDAKALLRHLFEKTGRKATIIQFIVVSQILVEEESLPITFEETLTVDDFKRVFAGPNDTVLEIRKDKSN